MCFSSAGSCTVLCFVLFFQISLKENASLNQDSNITMEIPTNTTIAYGLIELEIKHGGSFGKKCIFTSKELLPCFLQIGCKENKLLLKDLISP